AAVAGSPAAVGGGDFPEGFLEKVPQIAFISGFRKFLS
ncbi:MAG: hypothetical protein H6Q40_578, partial [Deltaproteobacteria bacterium]|nr:hypothetical protein [Deltaproteobacteria bacterium]